MNNFSLIRHHKGWQGKFDEKNVFLLFQVQIKNNKNIIQAIKLLNHNLIRKTSTICIL